MAVARRSDKLILASRVHTADKSYVSLPTFSGRRKVRTTTLRNAAGFREQCEQNSHVPRVGISDNRQGSTASFRVYFAVSGATQRPHPLPSALT